jgi:ethanolamine ammonia-lyase large subunit
LFVRRLLRLRRAPEFEAWLQAMGLTDAQGALRAAVDQPALAASLGPLLPGLF